METNEATQTHCYNPVAPAYPIWAYYAHGRQHRCQEDPVSLHSGRLEKTTKSSPHYVAQHHLKGFETILELHARNDDAMHSTDYAVSKCLSIHLSVTHRYSVEMAKRIVKCFHHRLVTPF